MLQTNEWKSLARILGLGPQSYSALLLACELVKVKKQKDGLLGVNINYEGWDSFLSQYGLRNEFEEEMESYTSKLQRGLVTEKAMIENKIDGDGKRYPHMHMIRIGKIAPGRGIVPGSQEINRREAPPRNNLEMLRAKTAFFKSTQGPLSVFTLDHRDDVDVVNDWVLMKEKVKPESEPESESEPEYESEPEPECASPPRSVRQANVSPAVSEGAGDKREPDRKQGESPPKKTARPTPSASQAIPDKLRKELPSLTQFQSTDDFMSMQPAEVEQIFAEIARVCERTERPA